MLLTALTVLQGALTMVGGLKLITPLTPTKVDDKIVGGLGKYINIGLKILNTLALNVGKDKNKDA